VLYPHEKPRWRPEQRHPDLVHVIEIPIEKIRCLKSLYWPKTFDRAAERQRLNHTEAPSQHVMLTFVLVVCKISLLEHFPSSLLGSGIYMPVE